MYISTSFGERIKQRRKALALTQADLARHARCARVTIQKIEAGHRRPSQQLAECLADGLAIPTEERATFIQSARSLPANGEACVLLLHSSFPMPATPLIGRGKDLAVLRAMLLQADVRLLTMSGSPGVGKTRLAIQVAADVAAAFADGVRFVPLAPIRDPDLVASAIAQTLDVHEVGKQSLLDTLIDYLRPKQMLLVLDNFEHVLTAAPLIAHLLEQAPHLKVLVTSRVLLHLSAEHEFVVPPLALPDLDALPAWDKMTDYAAVAFFVTRARVAKADFALTAANAPVIAAICVRLDGLPLAIQLAAARSKVLTPQALLRRLDQRLPLLTNGAVDTIARHHTLHAAIAWSYDLLPADEQALFRRLGIFVGGCTLEAVEAVCADVQWQTADWESNGQATSTQNSKSKTQVILDKLTALIDKSLLQPMANADEEPRFTLLETIREFALEQLAAHGEQAATQQCHAAYYLAFAEAAEPELNGPQLGLWFARLELEFNNIRAAARWALDREDMPTVARLAGALFRFWIHCGHWSEVRQWLNAALAIPTALTPSVRVKALYCAALLAYNQADLGQALALLQENLTLARALDDQAWTSKTLSSLAAVIDALGDYAQAAILYEESLELSRALENHYSITLTLTNLGITMMLRGNYTRAIECYEEGLALFRSMGDKAGTAFILTQLGVVHHCLGDYRKANSLLEEGIALAREVGDKWHVAWALQYLSDVALSRGADAQALALSEEGLTQERGIGNKDNIAILHRILGVIRLHQGECAQAGELLRNSLALACEIEEKMLIAESLEALADAAVRQGQPRKSVQFCSAAVALRTAIHVPLPPGKRPPYDRTINAARTQLGEAAFKVAWTDGRTLPLEQIIAEALEPAPQPESTPVVATPAQSTYPADLTQREVEVLRLVAAGLTTAQVAEQLVVSPRTVSTHLESIYSKLGVHSRSAATRFAIEHGLV